MLRRVNFHSLPHHFGIQIYAQGRFARSTEARRQLGAVLLGQAPHRRHAVLELARALGEEPALRRVGVEARERA